MTSWPATRRPGGADPAMGLARNESQSTPRANLSSLRAAQRPRVRRSPVCFDLRSLVDLLLAENFTHPAAHSSCAAGSRSGHRENPRATTTTRARTSFTITLRWMNKNRGGASSRTDRAPLTPRRSSPRRRRRLQPPRVRPAPSRTRGCFEAASPAAARRRPGRLRPTTESPRCR